MTLKQVTLAFENCESFDVPADHIAYLLVSGITTTKFFLHGDEVETAVECEDFMIHLTKAAGELLMPSWVTGDESISLASRLHYRDIVAVILTYENHYEEYRVQWSDVSDTYNDYMSVVDEGDEIHITIHQ